MTMTQKHSFYWDHFELHMGHDSVLMPPFGGWSKMLKLGQKIENST